MVSNALRRLCVTIFNCLKGLYYFLEHNITQKIILKYRTTKITCNKLKKRQQKIINFLIKKFFFGIKNFLIDLWVNCLQYTLDDCRKIKNILVIFLLPKVFIILIIVNNTETKLSIFITLLLEFICTNPDV